MRKLLWAIVVLVPIAAGTIVAPLFAMPEQTNIAPLAVPPEVLRWGFVAAALAAGLAAMGAAYAVAVVGAAAMGAVAEKPETAGRALIFVGLAEGIAIYGLIIAIMILGRLG
jgi:V/A-type H+-transporting ATPase subunit K